MTCIARSWAQIREYLLARLSSTALGSFAVSFEGGNLLLALPLQVIEVLLQRCQALLRGLPGRPVAVRLGVRLRERLRGSAAFNVTKRRYSTLTCGYPLPFCASLKVASFTWYL